MRIVVDAMGTDNHPAPDVAGSVLAAREFGYEIILTGDEKLIRTELSKHDTHDLPIDIAPAGSVITMTDPPASVGKTKPDSSMHVGMNLVKSGDADAFVTMGNTGAAHAIATLYTLRRIPGVKRPALSGIYPVGGKNIIMLDLGANSDSKAEWLAQFAIMGSIYAHSALGLVSPRIGLLSNGEEEGKGNALIKEASALIEKLPLNYIGNVEPKEILQAKVDVIVADGFVGNIFVKTFESSVSFFTALVREEIRHDIFSMLGGLLLKPAFNRVRRRSDTFEVGGAPLLGVNGVVIIGHGRSNATAIKNAIRQAAMAVDGRVINAIRDGLQDIPVSDNTLSQG